MKNNVFKGYISSRPIEGNFIPQRIQNMVIRIYTEKNQKIFSLSATEYIMEDSYMMLGALIREIQNFEALVFYSIFMLPTSKTDREYLYAKCFKEKIELHFAFEEIAIKCESDISMIEDILLVKKLTQNMDTKLLSLKTL